ncbi:Phage Gp37Gp68, partial [Candidatus Magnetoovum chiemensis]
MALNSKIEWTQGTWNPVTGCTKVSLGCHNCYAEKIAKRLKLCKVKRY